MTVGDSINHEDIKIACSSDNNVTKIYTIFANGNVYSISMEDFLSNCIDWNCLEGKQMRSISIHNYKKEFKI